MTVALMNDAIVACRQSLRVQSYRFRVFARGGLGTTPSEAYVCRNLSGATTVSCVASLTTATQVGAGVGDEPECPV